MKNRGDRIKFDYEIIGPDNIMYYVKIINVLPEEPFISVALNVKNISTSCDYWVHVLNMQVLAYINNYYLRVSYGVQIPLEFYQIKQQEIINHAKASGRIAFTTSVDQGPYIIHDLIVEKNFTIHTKPVTLPTPGKADVVVVILQDPDEYEICFVGEKGFDDLSTTKSGDEIVDWNKRSDFGADHDQGKYEK